MIDANYTIALATLLPLSAGSGAMSLFRFYKQGKSELASSLALSSLGFLVLGIIITIVKNNILDTSTLMPMLYASISLVGASTLIANWQPLVFRITISLMLIIGVFVYLSIDHQSMLLQLVGIFGLVILVLVFSIFQSRLSSIESKNKPIAVQAPSQLSDQSEDGNPDQLDKTQSELVHNEKLKALGIMSAGLAHEINNPLNYSVLGLDLLKQEGRTMMAPEFEAIISDVEDGLLRIKNIVKDLKVFSYKDMKHGVTTETFLVGDAISAAIRITAKATEDIEVTTTLEAPYRATGELSSIVQVLVNLLSNSAESIRQKYPESGGRIDVFGKVRESRYYIEVVDDGMGISRQGIQNLFTPFYTTKSTGLGTGLGLSVSSMIVERHGGKIAAESIPGEWASISFDLLLDTTEP